MASGDCVEFFTPHRAEFPSSTYATHDERNDRNVLDFSDAADEYCYFVGKLADNYDGGGVDVTIYFMMSTATGSNVELAVAFEKLTTGEDYDSDSFAAEQTTTEAVPGTSGHMDMGGAISFTDGAQMDSVGAGDLFRLKVKRKGSHANDTASGDLELLAVDVVEQ
jgi:hypothetical protein